MTMATKAQRIEQGKQAIRNLVTALQDLNEEGASAADRAPYEANLKAEQAKLDKLTGDK